MPNSIADAIKLSKRRTVFLVVDIVLSVGLACTALALWGPVPAAGVLLVCTVGFHFIGRRMFGKSL